MKKKIISIVGVSVVIGLIIILICVTPTIQQNKFMGYLEKGEYKHANGLYNANKNSSFFKNESEKIIEILDDGIEKILIDLYNEQPKIEEAMSLVNLHFNIASTNGLPTENGLMLSKTIDMYSEIASIKAAIEEGDFSAIGRGLLSTAYADDETYAEILTRNMDEKTKNDIVIGIDSAVDYHLSRAEGNWDFAKIPSLLSEESIISTYLLDDTTRNNMVGKIVAYNRSRACAVNKCDGWTKNTYCEEHKCEDDDCNNLKQNSMDYCSKHTCIVSGCTGYREGNGDNYCYSHECSESGCSKYANSGNYCSSHVSGKNDNSSSGTFTNKYGNRTTKCVVSGCSNTIASSGDTNCCVYHSNKCGNCNCYIDGDAMFCMSCLEKALR